MATVNKNFKVKNGLVVEGSTATVNGNNVLVETASDQYIIDLIGGETLVTSVESTQMEVISGELNIKSGVFDVSGAAAAAQSAAASDATSKANAAQAAAISAAATDATTKANAAQAAAEGTAAAALSSAISTEVSNRNTAISTAVSTLVDGAPDLLNTLNELAAAINDDANYTTTLTSSLATKAPLASPELTGVPTAPTAAANTNTTQIATTAFAKAEADAAEAAAIAHADALTTSDVAEGTSQYFTDARAKSSAADLLVGATKTNITITGTGSGLVITAENGVADSTTSDLAEGSNLYFTNARAISATAASYDVLGAASAAQSAAATDATDKVAAEAALRISGDAASVATAAADATTKANNAASAANSYTDGKIATEVTDRNNAISSAISTEVSNRNTAISTAVSGLVDGAPALLDTLNELALALGDSPDTITNLTTLVGTKAPLESPALTGVPTAPTAAADTNTTQVATTAFAKAEADAAQAAAEATAAAANTAQENGTTPFTALNINSVAKQVAATLSVPTAGVQTAYSWAKADFRSAEFLVRVGAGANTEMSKVLLTLDTSDNIAITEYGIVSTNVALSTVSAAISGSNVELKVTTLNNTSVITVMGTLIK
jgi:trimeric autotransporter adhesin